MTDRPQQFPSQSRRHGFTLVEMLVVIAIIVLAMILAPSRRSALRLTGSRSTEAAENAITSYIGQVRAEAIGLQQIEGVMFLLDTTADRVMCVAVQDVTQGSDNPQKASGGDSYCTFLDLIPNHDPFYLPSGIRMFVAKDGPPNYNGNPFNGQWKDAFPNWRYLGPNFYPVNGTDDGNTIYPIGVILFGTDGKLLTTQYGLRLNVGGGIRSSLGQLLYTNNSLGGSTQPNWPALGQHLTRCLTSQVAFVLCDKESFMNGGQGFIDHDNPAANELAVDAWLDANTTPIIVNRYDGTLMRAE